MVTAPGYYGKFPALGDFVRGGVDRRFVQAWDAFLQAGLLASRQSLGAAWRDSYQTAPIWRFALGAGVVAGGASFGVMMPSQDAVGRLFPLTLVGAGPPPALNDNDYFTALEDVALNMLDSLRGKPELEAMLAALPAPVAGPSPPAGQSRWLSAPDAEFGTPLGLACNGLPTGTAFKTLLTQDTSDWTGEIITKALA